MDKNYLSLIDTDIDTEEPHDITAFYIAPVIPMGDVIGTVIIYSKDPKAKIGDLERKLAETAAGFLAKQLEQYKYIFL